MSNRPSFSSTLTRSSLFYFLALTFCTLAPSTLHAEGKTSSENIWDPQITQDKKEKPETLHNTDPQLTPSFNSSGDFVFPPSRPIFKLSVYDYHATVDIYENAKENIDNKVTEKQPDQDQRWNLSGNAGVLYNDNLSRPEADLVSEKSDHAYTFDFNGKYRFVQTEAVQVQASYDFYQSLYEDRSEFDLRSHGFTLSASHSLESVDYGGFLNFTKTELDREGFLDLYLAIARIGVLHSSRFYTDVSYLYQKKDFDALNDRDADNHGLSLTQFIFFFDSRAHINLGYNVEFEDAQGAEFDYLAHKIKGGFKVPAFGDSELTASYEYQLRDYENITPSIGQEREDNIQKVRVAFTQPFFDCLRLKLAYEYFISDSNLPSVDYVSNVASATLGFEF